MNGYGCSYAVDRLAGVAGVGVSLEVALGELEVVARDDGVQGVGGAGEDLASVAGKCQ